MHKKLLHFISSIESSGDFVSWALWLVAIVLLRNGFEALISEGKAIVSVLFFVQYGLFYMAAFLIAGIWLGIFTGNGKASSRVAALGTSVILLTPILDILISGKRTLLGYPLFKSFGEYLAAALSFGVTIPFYTVGRGISPGMRIELIIIYMLIFTYILLKKRCVIKAFLAAYFFHATLFLLPGAVTFLNSQLAEAAKLFWGASFAKASYIRPTSTLTIIVAILLIIWLFIIDKRYIRLLLLSIRPIRFMHYGGMVIAGVWIGCDGSIGKFVHLNVIDFIALMLGYFALWLFAVLINDNNDIESDRISQNMRPAAIGLITSSEGKKFAWTSLVLGLVILGSRGIAVFEMALIFIAAAYVYSMPPVRTKRFPFLSTLTLAIASLGNTVMGYAFVRGNIDKFPGAIAAAIIVGITLGFITKDIKDIEGDKAAGVITLPNILGRKNALLPCAILSASSIILIPLITGVTTITPISIAVLFGALIAAYIIFAKSVDERIPMVLYLIYASMFLGLWLPSGKP